MALAPLATPRRSVRAAAAAVLTAVAVYALLTTIAMVTYPGGTWMDRDRRGFDLARNFVCDLVSPVALNGEPNPVGSVAAPIAMLALVPGLALFWWIVPRLFSARRLGRAVRAAGLLSIAGLIAVPLMPSSRVGALHAVPVFAVAVPALLAAWLAVAGLAARGGRATRDLATLGAVAVAIATVDACLYAAHLARGGAVPVALPALQRVASLLLLWWMVAVALRVRRLGRAC